MLSEGTFVVTGGLGRVGSAIWPAIVEAGGTAIVTTRSSKRAHAFNQNAPARAHAIAFDPKSREDFDAFWSHLRADGHTVCGLVNNAMGTVPTKPMDKLEVSDWQDAVKVDLSDLISICNSLIAIENPVSIVNVSSIYGAMAPDFSIYDENRLPPSPIYAATKAAQLQLTKYLAVAWADKRVRVNAVCLGGVLQTQAEEFLEAYGRMVPQRRMITPTEAADSICFLLSNKASGISGHTIFVDGGRHAW